jgi:ubiquinone/menaquinone biosynthesis C-methylase UbiE
VAKNKFKQMKFLIKYIGQMFAKPEGVGGNISTLIMNLMNKKMYGQTLEYLDITNKDTILDIGFGNGFMLKKVAKYNPKKLYGIDISEDMLAKVKNKLNDEQIELFLADAQKMPFADNSIDKIYTINTVYFWENPLKTIAEIKRVLKPDGLFFNIFYDKKFLDKITYTKYGFTKYEMDDLIELTQKGCLKFEKLIDIQKNKSACIVARK